MTTNSQDSSPNKDVRDGVSAGGDNSGVESEIPGKDEGVGVGASDEPNTFEPEEAGEAVKDDDAAQ